MGGIAAPGVGGGVCPFDATVVLESLSREVVYVIGGMVDNKRIMGKTRSIAQQQGIRAARLPIAELLGADVDPVLNVNTVVEVLSSFQATGCWQQALRGALPPRKQKTRKRSSTPKPTEKQV